MKKPFGKIIKNIEVPSNPQHKEQLKRSLMLKAEELYSEKSHSQPGFWSIFQLGFALLGIIAVISFINIPLNTTPDKSDYFTFIEKAKAYAEANKNKIHYYKIRTENIDITKGTSSVWSETEVWRSENGDQLWKNTMFSEVIMGENGEAIIPPPTFDLVKHDDKGNEYLYTKIQQVGTEKRETPDGDIIEQPLYNVHPGKQLNKTEELQKLASTTYCIATEENKDLKGVSMAKIMDNSEDIEIISHNIPKNRRYRILSELAGLFEGRLSKTDLLNILGDYKDSPLIQHEYIQEDGKNYYKVSLNIKDFAMISSSSAEGLETSERPDTLNIFYFDADTYALDKIEVWDKLYNHKTVSTYEDRYREDLDEAELFNLEGYVLTQITSAFEKKFHKDSLGLTDGCYKDTKPLTPAESQPYLNRINSYFNADHAELSRINSKKMWGNPLSNDPYYYLPQ